MNLQSELTSLLKTAEELRIKGLAEVSWRSDREMEAIESGDDEADHGAPQAKKLKPDPYSPKSAQNSISTSLLSRDEFHVSEKFNFLLELATSFTVSSTSLFQLTFSARHLPFRTSVSR